MNIYLGSLKRLIKGPLNWLFILGFSALIVLAAALFSNLSSGNEDDDINIGVVDMDGSILSETLVQSLETRYTVKRLNEDDDITAELSNNRVSYVLTIGEGYQSPILSGTAPELSGVALEASDVQHLVSSAAENQTRALVTLAAGVPESELKALIDIWRAQSVVHVSLVEAKASWDSIAAWLNFYAWTGPLIALFLVRTLMQDRRGGLPERVGALPKSRRNYLLGQILAALTMSELAVVLILFGTSVAVDYPLPNAAHLVLIFTLYSMFTTGLSFGFYSVIRNEGTVAAVVTIGSTLLAMLGGSYWPVEVMPEFMQRLAYFSPVYWFVRAMNNIEMITTQTYWLPVLMLLAFSVVVYLMASWVRPQRAAD